MCFVPLCMHLDFCSRESITKQASSDGVLCEEFLNLSVCMLIHLL